MTFKEFSLLILCGRSSLPQLRRLTDSMYMQKQEIQIFNFNSNQVRLQIINGKEYFCAKDITDALGYSNGRKTIQDNCKEKGVTISDTLTNGGIQKLTFIDEANVLRLIVNSKLPTAEKFEAWVFEEILPQIRKTGKFDVQPSLPQNYIQALEFLVIAEKEKLELQNTVSEQQTTIENRDKIIFDISNIQDTYSLREASKNLIVGEKALQEYLKSKKWWIYLSDGSTTKKMYSTSYAKDSNFAIDKLVLNKARQKFYHQFRITKHGMDFLIKRRQEIVK